jgi:hypothetical protein
MNPSGDRNPDEGQLDGASTAAMYEDSGHHSPPDKREGVRLLTIST